MVMHGCAHVAGKYLQTSSFLTDGTNGIATIGFPSVKVFMTGNYTTDYPVQSWGSTPTTLEELAATTPFSTVFGTAGFSWFFINALTFANGVNNDWINNASTTYLQNEYDEMYDFAVHLLTTYSNKNFVIQNWEGDWSLIGSFTPTNMVPPYVAERMAAYLRVRQLAIRAAQRAVSSTSRILHGVEVNRVLDDYSRRVHRSVLRNVQPDMVSFSAYECINTWGTGQVDAEANIETLLTRAVKHVQAEIGTQTPLYIGEYGWPEAEAGFTGLSLSVSGLIAKVATVSTSLGLTHAIYWNYYDNEEISPGNPRGYYLIKPDTTNSGAGTYFNSILP